MCLSIWILLSSDHTVALVKGTENTRAFLSTLSIDLCLIASASIAEVYLSPFDSASRYLQHPRGGHRLEATAYVLMLNETANDNRRFLRPCASAFAVLPLAF